ncbi:Transmembrane nucleoporin [Rhizoctonia solani]
MPSSQAPHYAWASGHVLLLLCAAVWLPSSLRHPFSTPKTAYSYRLSLVPYAIFSTFHVLTFVRTTVLPKLAPPKPPAREGERQAKDTPLQKQLHQLVKSQYDPAMNVCAWAELVILVRTIVGVFLFWNGFIAPIAFAHFLRLRFYYSLFSRNAIKGADGHIQGYVNGTPAAKAGYEKFKEVVTRWSGTVLVPAGGAAEPGPAPRR